MQDTEEMQAEIARLTKESEALREHASKQPAGFLREALLDGADAIQNVISGMIKREEKKAEKDAEGNEQESKKQWVVIQTSEEVSWVIQIPCNLNPESVPSMIQDVASEFNNTKKGKRLPCTTVSDVFNSVRRAMLVDNDIWLKSKEPAVTLKIENKF